MRVRIQCENPISPILYGTQCGDSPVSNNNIRIIIIRIIIFVLCVFVSALLHECLYVCGAVCGPVDLRVNIGAFLLQVLSTFLF